MFNAHREKKEAAERQSALDAWSEQVHELQYLLEIAQGQTQPSYDNLILKPGEAGVFRVSGVGLIEERKGAGHWQGASQGISFPIGKIAGRPVRYRVGEARGHYVSGPPVPTAVNHGIMTVTTQRIVYQGATRTAECPYAKLLGIQHSPGVMTISVSNRQRPTVLSFGPALDAEVSNCLSVALAVFHSEAAQAAGQLQSQIAELQASKPASA